MSRNPCWHGGRAVTKVTDEYIKNTRIYEIEGYMKVVNQFKAEISDLQLIKNNISTHIHNKVKEAKKKYEDKVSLLETDKKRITSDRATITNRENDFEAYKEKSLTELEKAESKIFNSNKKIATFKIENEKKLKNIATREKDCTEFEFLMTGKKHLLDRRSQEINKKETEFIHDREKLVEEKEKFNIRKKDLDEFDIDIKKESKIIFEEKENLKIDRKRNQLIKTEVARQLETLEKEKENININQARLDSTSKFIKEKELTLKSLEEDLTILGKALEKEKEALDRRKKLIEKSMKE